MTEYAVLLNVDTQEVHRIPEGVVEVGRSLSHPVAVMDASLSRNHARIYNVAEGFWVEDLGSTNGTFVRANPIQEPTSMVAGELVQFGNVVFRYEIRKEFSVQVTTRLPTAPVESITPVEVPASDLTKRETERVAVQKMQMDTEKIRKITGRHKILPVKYAATDSGLISQAPATTAPSREPASAFQPLPTAPDAPPFPWKWLLLISILASLFFGAILGFVLARVL
ncbi:MAG: FHA domain-containing protein [Candidatus Methylacidiphilales bacterium]